MMNKSIQMWVCVADDKFVDESSLANTKKSSIKKEVARAQEQLQPDLDWNFLKRIGYKCVKADVTIKLV